MAGLLKIFEPPEAKEPCYKDEAEMRGIYKYWRKRQLLGTFIGYGVFYFVRKNIPIAIPLIESDLHMTKADIGKIISISDVVYGISKFVNGFLGDRCNPRYFMGIGLLMSALANFLFGMNTALAVLIFAWVLNGWFQGMGSPPCTRILCHWFSPSERGTYWSIWNTSHQVGLATVLIMAGYLGEHFGWRYIFYVPAALAGITSIYLVWSLRDTPASLGLPAPEVYKGEKEPPKEIAKEEKKQSSKEFFNFLCKHVFNNYYLWLVCIANFFIYILRYGFVTWMPSYLDVKGVQLTSTGWIIAGFETAGLISSILAGWITDKYFKGRRAPVCVAYMALATLSVIAFWKLEAVSTWVYASMLLLVGFLIYGPQVLVAIMATDFATKKAAATAVGMTGLLGYLSSIVSGWGLGYVVDNFGWNAAFIMLIVCGIGATLPFCLAWNAKPVSLDDDEDNNSKPEALEGNSEDIAANAAEEPAAEQKTEE
ncbi:MAG: MFS transporter [bacterium]|nr:MFS transporter [bacterium]